MLSQWMGDDGDFLPFKFYTILMVFKDYARILYMDKGIKQFPLLSPRQICVSGELASVGFSSPDLISFPE